MQRRPERLAWALRIPDPPWRALVRGKMGNRTVQVASLGDTTVIQRPENQGVSGIKSHSLKAQESRAPMSEGRRRWSFSSERERIHLSFTFLFHLLPPMD